MSTKSYTSLRRLSGYVLTLLFFCVAFSKGAEAQATPPVATGSFATTLTPPSGLGTVLQTTLDNYGNWLVMDYANGALYEYPVNGGAVITLAAPKVAGGYNNPGVVVDIQNNLYIGGNWNNCLTLFPWDAKTGTWDGLASMNATTNTIPDQCGSAPYSFAQYGDFPSAPLGNNYFQPWGLALLPGNVLAIGNQDLGNFIFTLPIVYPGPTTCSSGNCSPTASPGTANSSAGTLILLQMKARPNSVAADKFGNIYFVEDSGGISGAYMIPAGNTSVPADTSSVIVRVDPNLGAVTGVATDTAGNVYISDSTAGVVMVPNPSGTPNTKGAILLTPTPGTGAVSVDLTRGVLYVPTSNNGLVKVKFNAAEFGSLATGTTSSAQTASFGFNAAATPASFAIEEAGATTPDFALASGGTCKTGTAYAALGGCTESVTFTPHSAGTITARLVALDASGNVLGSINLHGVGTGPEVQVLPGGESVIGATLKTPSQVAVDAGGNTYVADSGLGAVEFYPKGYGAVAAKTTIGTGLKAPTGVAVDGAGDVFIADSGNIVEVPMGSAGLIAANQVTLKSGLGAKLQLAADVSHLYISDPNNHRIVKLGNPGGSSGILAQSETDYTGFIAPSAIALDSSGNLYIADGTNLYEITTAGVQSTLLTNLPAALGLAVDASGSVYVATTGGTRRIPSVAGTLTTSAETTVAANVTAPTSVAVDAADNVYIADATAEDVQFVSSSATTNFGTLTTTTGTQANTYSVLNAGNAALTITAFAGTPDYSATSTTCIGSAIAVDGTCSVTITFNPGPGDQGTLAGQVLVTSNAANSPVGVNVTGVGAALAASTTKVTVTNATVDGAPAVITVTPTSGTGVAPSGQVTLTITGTNLTTPTVVTGTLSGGTVTLAVPQLAAGTYTYTVTYQGDRVYGTSTATITVTVAAGAVKLVQPPLVPSLNLVQLGSQWYVLAQTNAQEPYDGSVAQYEFTYNVSVVATDGVALIGQPVYVNGKLTTVNYGTVTYSGAPYTASGSGCAPVPVSSNGTAPLATDCLTIDTSNTSIPDIENTYTITPMYSPAGTGAVECNPTCVVNPNYTAVTGTPITLTALRNPMVQIVANPSALSISAGSSATTTLTLNSILGYGIGGAGGLLNNYSLPVQLSCDGLPAYTTCSFSYPTPDPTDPQSVDVGPPVGTVLSYEGATAAACTKALPGAQGGCFGPGTVIMTLTTSVPTGIIANLHGAPDGTTVAAMLGLGLLGLVWGKKRSLRERVPTLLGLLICVGFVAGLSGCSTKQLGTNSGTTTPAGTYTITVTGKEVGSQVIKAAPGIMYGNENQVTLPFTMSVTVN